MGIEVMGLGGLILLILNIWALVSIISSSASTGGKVLWCLLVLILPLIGLIVWFFAGPRSAAASV
ncbi:MAG: PLD nuclease N-terminal domain-containing protein [Pseudomonadota bacterium]